jgi:phosphoribosyl 1,2-cyclic phosphodiesterase
MQITFWGVRGSIATAGPDVARFGGNTTCLEVRSGADRIVIDAGTGLRALGDKLNEEARALGRPPKATFFFTHLHWDHIQGFPFFAPAFRPDVELELYGPRGATDERSEVLGIQEVLERQMRPPSFPVPLAAMAAKKRFRDVKAGDTHQVGGFTVSALALDHPQGVLGYRIEAGGASMCFATDTELGKGETDDALIELARGVDLLICDAQYTEAEYAGKNGPCRRGWGHSTYVAACKLAKAAGAKRLALFHHDPSHDDAMIEAMESDAQTIFSGAFAARERTTVELLAA